MSLQHQEPREPLPEFVSETADEVMQLRSGVSAPGRGDIEALLTRFMSFEAGTPIDQGYERILVSKGEHWVPTSGRSVKLGNLRFNLGTLFEAIASGVSAGFAATTVPIVAVFTGLLAIRKLRRAAEVDLSEREALVIWCVWSCEQRGIPATTEEIRQCGLKEATRVGSALQPSIAEVQNSLERLEKIGAIRRAEDGSWETHEAVIVQT